MLTTTRGPLALAACALLATGGFSVMQAQEPAAKPEGKAIFGQMVDAYKKTDRLSAVVTVKVTEPGSDEPQEAAKATISLDRAGRYARTDEGEAGMGKFIANKGETFFHIPMADAVIAQKAETLRDAVGNDMAAGQLILPALFVAEDAEKLAEEMGLSNFQVAGEAKVGDVAAYDLTADQAMGLHHFYVSKGEKPQLLKVQFTPQPGVVVAFHFDNQKANPELSDELFAFEMPPDTTKYDSIEALMAAMQDAPEPSQKLIGKAAPDFELKDRADKAVKLSSHKDKNIVVLDFWATWCGPCVQAMPILTEVTGKYAEKGVVFYGVNQREDKEKVEKFLADKKLELQVLFDSEGKVGNLYKVTGIPQSVIIGKNGTIEAVHIGMSPDLKEKLTKELETLTSGGTLIEKTAEEAEAPKEG